MVKAKTGDNAPVVAVIQGRSILVANLQDDVMLEFNFKGEVVKSSRCPVKGPVTFLSEDHEGRLVVSSLGERAVVLVSGSGERMQEFRGLRPGAAVRDTWGHVIATDTGIGQVVVFSPEGAVLGRGSVHGLALPRHLAYDPHLDCLYVSSRDGVLACLSLLSCAEDADLGRGQPGSRGTHTEEAGSSPETRSVDGQGGESSAGDSPLDPELENAEVALDGDMLLVSRMENLKEIFGFSFQADGPRMENSQEIMDRDSQLGPRRENLEEAMGADYPPDPRVDVFEDALDTSLQFDPRMGSFDEALGSSLPTVPGRGNFDEPMGADLQLDPRVERSEEASAFPPENSAALTSLFLDRQAGSWHGESADWLINDSEVSHDSSALWGRTGSEWSAAALYPELTVTPSPAAPVPVWFSTLGVGATPPSVLMPLSPEANALLASGAYYSPELNPLYCYSQVAGSGFLTMTDEPYAGLGPALEVDSHPSVSDAVTETFEETSEATAGVFPPGDWADQPAAALVPLSRPDPALPERPAGVEGEGAEVARSRYRASYQVEWVRSVEKGKKDAREPLLSALAFNAHSGRLVLADRANAAIRQHRGESGEFHVLRRLLEGEEAPSSLCSAGSGLDAAVTPSGQLLVLESGSCSLSRAAPIPGCLGASPDTAPLVAALGPSLFAVCRLQDNGLLVYDAEASLVGVAPCPAALPITWMTSAEGGDGQQRQLLICSPGSRAVLVVALEGEEARVLRAIPLSWPRCAVMDEKGFVLAIDGEDDAMVLFGPDDGLVLRRKMKRVESPAFLAYNASANVFYVANESSVLASVKFQCREREDAQEPSDTKRMRIPPVPDEPLTENPNPFKVPPLDFSSLSPLTPPLSALGSGLGSLSTGPAVARPSAPVWGSSLCLPPPLGVSAGGGSSKSTGDRGGAKPSTSHIQLSVKWTKNIEPKGSETKPPAICALAFNSRSRHIIVSDEANLSLKRYNSKGHFLVLRRFEGDVPSSLVCSATKAAAVRRGKLEFLETGTYTEKASVKIKGCDASSDTPPLVTAFSDGSFALCRMPRNEVHLLDREGRVTKTLACPARGPLTSASTNREDNLLVCSSAGSGSVAVFPQCGGRVQRAVAVAEPRAAVLDRRGFLLAIDGAKESLAVVSPGAEEVLLWERLPEMASPAFLAYDGDEDQLYMASRTGTLACVALKYPTSASSRVAPALAPTVAPAVATPMGPTVTHTKAPPSVAPLAAVPAVAPPVAFAKEQRRPMPVPLDAPLPHLDPSPASAPASTFASVVARGRSKSSSTPLADIPSGDDAWVRVSLRWKVKLQRHASDSQDPRIESLALNPACQRLVLGDGANQKVRFYGTDGGFLATKRLVLGLPSSLACNGAVTAAVAAGSLCLLETRTLALKSRTPIPGCKAVAGPAAPVVAALGDGSFVLVNTDGNKVVSFTQDEEVTSKIQSSAKGPLTSVSECQDGHLLVSSAGSSSVVVLSRSGSKLKEFPCLAAPTSCVQTKQGLVVAASGVEALQIFTQEGQTFLLTALRESPRLLVYDPEKDRVYASADDGILLCLELGDSLHEDQRETPRSVSSLDSQLSGEVLQGSSAETSPRSVEAPARPSSAQHVPRPLSSRLGEQQQQQVTLELLWVGSARLPSDREAPGISALALGANPARLAVCDVDNRRIEHFSVEGAYQSHFPQNDAATPTSLILWGATAAAVVEGSLHLLDAASYSLKTRAPIPGCGCLVPESSSSSASSSSSSSSSCCRTSPPVVSAFSDGIFVVASNVGGEKEGERLLLFGGSGSHLASLPSPVAGPLVHLHPTGEGSLLACSWGAQCVAEVSVGGKLLASYPAPDMGGVGVGGESKAPWLPTAAVRVGRGEGAVVVVAAKDCPHLAVYPGPHLRPWPLGVEGVTSPLHLTFDPASSRLYVASWSGEMACLRVRLQ